MDDESITREDLISLIVKRQRLWLDASVVIANMLPMAWDVIEGYLVETQNVTNLLLNDLQYDPTADVLRYCVFEEGDTLIFNIPIPLSLAVDPGEEGEKLFAYLNTLPAAAPEQTEGSTQADKVRNRLKFAMSQHPGMYMDLDRMTELELDSARGEFFKYPVADKLQ